MPRFMESSTERTIRRSPSFGARLSRKLGDDFRGSCGRCRCISGKGNARRKAFSAIRSMQMESLPPENSSTGAALAGHLAHDVDGPIRASPGGRVCLVSVDIEFTSVEGRRGKRAPVTFDVQAAFLWIRILPTTSARRTSSPMEIGRVHGRSRCWGRTCRAGRCRAPVLRRM